MTNQEKFELHEKICKDMMRIYREKSSDYGNSVEQLYKDLGPVSLLTRIGDKYNRLKSLLVNRNDMKVKDESISDTLMDMANYALITLITLEEEKRNAAKKRTPVIDGKIKADDNLTIDLDNEFIIYKGEMYSSADISNKIKEIKEYISYENAFKPEPYEVLILDCPNLISINKLEGHITQLSNDAIKESNTKLSEQDSCMENLKNSVEILLNYGFIDKRIYLDILNKLNGGI